VRWFWKGYLGISFDLAYVLEGNNRRFADEATRAGTVDFHGNLFVRYLSPPACLEVFRRLPAVVLLNIALTGYATMHSAEV